VDVANANAWAGGEKNLFEGSEGGIWVFEKEQNIRTALRRQYRRHGKRNPSEADEAPV